MSLQRQLYGQSLALLTDLYQLTMAQGYWKHESADSQAVFHLFFRRSPFGGGYALACGLDSCIDFLQRFHFQPGDLAYLATLQGNDAQPLFESAFLRYLETLSFTIDLEALPEGTPVFPFEPLVRVRGPLLQCQLLETPLLNLINFQTLIATKASRVCRAAGDDPVLEFGLRRAHGIDGGVSASRAAFIGGCAATSNVLAGRLFDIPVRGTHAHSWVMSFSAELEAFQAYAEAMPHNCVFLVDTYDTLSGVRHAVAAGHRLRALGHDLGGLRLDSGDLASLSRRARQLLDENGFTRAVIVASNDLDEHAIEALKQRGAAIDIWGVGTKLVTASDDPALGGVYKLAALYDPHRGRWEHLLKLSEQPEKSSNPGIQQVRRFAAAPQGTLVGDMIFDEILGAGHLPTIVRDPATADCLVFPDDSPFEDLLQPVFRQGALVADRPSVHQARQRAARELARLPEEVKRLDSPAGYPVGLEKGLSERKMQLVRRLTATRQES